MRTFIDFDEAPIFAIPAVGMPRVVYEGMLIEGPQGWGEFSPPLDADPAALARWLTAAMEPSTVGWPDPVRGRVPVAVTVPDVDAPTAHRIVTESDCRTADVTVGTAGDIARLEAVSDALAADGSVRCTARGPLDAAAITALARITDIEFVAIPADLADVRRTVDVRIAVDATGVASLTEIADVAILHVGALGGVRRSMRVAEASELPCVVAAEPVTTVGLSSVTALAGALPELPYACGLGPGLAGDVVADTRSLRPVDGYLPVAPMPPGPDASQLSRYTTVTPERIAWWRDRLKTARAQGNS